MDRNDAMQVVVVVMRAVALRKESVDRNAILLAVLSSSTCRSPQGERG